MREVVCLVLKLREKKRTFVKIKRVKVDFFRTTTTKDTTNLGLGSF